MYKTLALFLILLFTSSQTYSQLGLNDEDLFGSELTDEKREAITVLIGISNMSERPLDAYSIASELLFSLGVEHGTEYDALIDRLADTVETSQAELEEMQYLLWHENFSLDELRELIAFSKTPQGEQTTALLFEVQKVMGALAAIQLESMANNAMVYLDELLKESVPQFSPLPPKISDLDKLRENVKFARLELDGTECLSANDSDSPTPLIREAPIYPRVARQHSIDGWVELRFDVTEVGTTENVQVTNSYPGTLFAKSAKQAVEHHIYCEGVRSSNRELRIVFEMAR